MPTFLETVEDLKRLAVVFSHRERLAVLPDGFIKFVPLLETPGAVLNALDIVHAVPQRTVAILFGAGDLF